MSVSSSSASAAAAASVSALSALQPPAPMEQVVSVLGLKRHPEGGYFRELHRSDVVIPIEALPSRYKGPRAASTSIVFLLDHGNFGALHKLASDEVWMHHMGHPIRIHMIDEAGAYSSVVLGQRLDRGERPQLIVPHGVWFGSEPVTTSPGEYGMGACMVSPGFEFEDFVMPSRSEFLRMYPAHREIIERLTLPDRSEAPAS